MALTTGAMASISLEDKRNAYFLMLRSPTTALFNPDSWAYNKRDDKNPASEVRSCVSIILDSNPEDGPAILAAFVDYLVLGLLRPLHSQLTSPTMIECVLETLAAILSKVPPGCISPLAFHEALLAIPKTLGRRLQRPPVPSPSPSAPTSAPTEQASVLRDFSSMLSEEAVLAGVRCLEDLMRIAERPHDDLGLSIAPAEASKELGKISFQEPLAFVIFWLLDILDRQKRLELHTAACATLTALFRRVEKVDLLVNVLPGVCSSLSKVVCKAESSNSRLLMACLDTLGDLICHALSDEQNSEFIVRAPATWADLKDPSVSSNVDGVGVEADLGSPSTAVVRSDISRIGDGDQGSDSATSKPSRTPRLKRSAQWLNQVDERLSGLFKAVSQRRNHPQWKVRDCFAQQYGQMAVACCQSLPATVSVLIETLVFYVGDPYPQVRQQCQRHLHELSLRSWYEKSFLDLLRASLHHRLQGLAQTLTRKTESEEQKLDALRIVNGYMILLKDASSVVLSTSLGQISPGLMELAVMDVSDVRIVEDRTAFGQYDAFVQPSTDDGVATIHPTEPTGSTGSTEHPKRDTNRKSIPSKHPEQFPRRKFAHFHDERIYRELTLTCRLMARYGNPLQLFDHFCSYLRESSNSSNSNSNSNSRSSGKGGNSSRTSHGSEGSTIANDPDVRSDYSVQALFYLNELCLGVGGVGLGDEPVQGQADRKKTARARRIAQSIVQEYIKCKIMDAPTHVSEAEADSGTQHDRPGPSGSSNALLLKGLPTSLEQRLHIVDLPRKNSVLSFNLNITRISLILEGLANCSRILKREFRPLLMDCVYQILEKIGHTNTIVNASANAALLVIAEQSGYATPRELILQNVDYIINKVSLRLGPHCFHAKAPVVLDAAIRIAGGSIIRFMADSIDEILATLDAYEYWSQPELLVALVTVMYRLTLAMDPSENAAAAPGHQSVRTEAPGDSDDSKLGKAEDTASPGTMSPSDVAADVAASAREEIETGSEPANAAEECEDTELAAPGVSSEIQQFCLYYRSAMEVDRQEAVSGPAKDGSEDAGGSSPEDVRDFFLGHLKQKEAAAAGEIGKDGEDGDDPMGAATGVRDPDPRKSSWEQDLCIRIVQKLHHFLAADSAQLRALALKTIRSAIPVLQTHLDEHGRENEFLNPLIHTIWPQILSRLDRDREHFVRLEALLLISTISEHSGGFVAKRLRSDVLPRFEQVFKQCLEVVPRGTTGRQRPLDGGGPGTFAAAAAAADRDLDMTKPFGVLFKIQYAVLENLSAILRSSKAIGLTSSDFDPLGRYIWRYLDSSAYHASIQQKAQEVLLRVAGVDADGVWYLVSALLTGMTSAAQVTRGARPSRQGNTPLVRVSSWEATTSPTAIEAMQLLTKDSASKATKDSKGASLPKTGVADRAKASSATAGASTTVFGPWTAPTDAFVVPQIPHWVFDRAGLAREHSLSHFRRNLEMLAASL
ncbi:armadillo-type protein [Polychytrium aggregatum]|uniref:armadillo-type protein n=1 Tax=Polychytrium aggregatum TaxID=110093 RepID=UPI0022FF3208|nr:armadillo-type protein [Polychytrium aggregatum]KAI9202743.1 armadillo-type protein [Polychytrium aggregatum]